MAQKKIDTQLVSSLARHTGGEHGQHLGDVLWWELNGGEVARVDLARIWVEAGLPAEYLPEPPGEERAFRAAVREGQLGHSDRLLRVAAEDERRIVVGLVAENRDGAGGLTYGIEGRVVLDRQTKTVTTDIPDHPIVKRVTTRFDVLRQVHTLDDVRRSMGKVLDGLAAINLRTHGGVLWVPRTGADQLRRLQSAIERIGMSRMYVLPITETPEGAATLSEIAQNTLEQDLAELQAEIETFVQMPPDRGSTLLRRLDAFTALRQRAQLFATVLRVQVGDLDQKIGILERTVGEMVSARGGEAAA